MQAGYFFHLPDHSSPTFDNLKRYLISNQWQCRSSKTQTHFNEDNFCFHPKAAQCLEFKHSLAELVMYYCLQIMPKTFVINDSNWPDVLSMLVQDSAFETNWILKPGMLNNGQGIHVFSTLKAIKNHFLSVNRLGGVQVLQQYISPHLLRDKRKYSLRQFVILTSFGGCYVYHQGYFNVAKYPYKDDFFEDLRCHLTNEHLLVDSTNVIQIPSDHFQHYPVLFEQIKIILVQLMTAIRCRYPEAFQCLPQRMALFGVDFMVDDSGRVWLLEANHGPCFPTQDSHPLQAHVYRDFWHHLVNNFIYPIASQSVSLTVDSAFFSAI